MPESMRTSQGIRVVIWNEFAAERSDERARAIYPYGIHEAIAAGLRPFGDLEIGTATQDEPGCGLPPARLRETDVLLWWGHRRHEEVPDSVADAVVANVQEGMGLIVLHSAHFAKAFIRLMGSSCRLGHWDEQGGRERIWTLLPQHPIVAGVPACLELPQTEMYSEPFDVPAPDDLVFISSFERGEVFRSGCVWRRGRGRVFYFRPGHETYPIYRHPEVLRILANAIRWLAGDRT